MISSCSAGHFFKFKQPRPFKFKKQTYLLAKQLFILTRPPMDGCRKNHQIMPTSFTRWRKQVSHIGINI
jgi:hypothetical protein